MFTLRSNRKYNTLIMYKRPYKFRFTNSILNSNPGHAVFLSTYNNSFLQYVVESLPVSNGTYKVKLTSVDQYMNENAGQQTTVPINFFTLPPTNVQVSLVGNVVTLTWTTSKDGNPTSYLIYGNGGTGSTSIDRTTIIATISGTLNTYSFTVANGNWSFIIESLNNSVLSNSMNKVSIVVPATATIPPKPGPSSNTNPNSALQPTGLLLTDVSVGSVNIMFLWLFGIQADTFNVYHDSGTGVMNYAAPAFTFARQGNLIQSYTTPQLFATLTLKTYQFVVRASVAGVEEKNTDVYSITVVGQAPPIAQALTVDSVF